MKGRPIGLDGAELCSLMERLGWSSQFMAEQMGVNVRTISLWRNDKLRVPGPIWYGLRLTLRLKEAIPVNLKGIAKSRLPNER